MDQAAPRQLPHSVYGDNTGTWITGTLKEVSPAATPGKVWLNLTDATLYAAEGVRQLPSTALNAPLKRSQSLKVGEGVAAQAILFGPEGKRFAGDRDDHWYFYFNGHQNPRGYVRGALEATYLPTTPATGFTAWLEKTRTTIIKATQHRAHGALTALLIGSQNAVPYALSEAYRNSGLLHLLVISGMQMSLVAGGVFLLIRKGLLWLPILGPWLAIRLSLKTIAAITALIAVTGYALLVGEGISVFRALLMVALGLAALAFGRTHDVLRLWALSAAALLLIWPEWVLRAGFQLSFAAVGGLILWGMAHGEGAFKRWNQKVRGLFESTLVASLATAPILALHFGAIPLAGILANLIAIPLMTLATWLGFLALLLWPLGFQNLALNPMEKLVNTTNHLAISAANWPYATIRLGKPPAVTPFASKNRDEPQGGVSHINGHYMAWPDTNPRTLRAFQRRWGIDKIEAQ